LDTWVALVVLHRWSAIAIAPLSLCSTYKKHELVIPGLNLKINYNNWIFSCQCGNATTSRAKKEACAVRCRLAILIKTLGVFPKEEDGSTKTRRVRKMEKGQPASSILKGIVLYIIKGPPECLVSQLKILRVNSKD